MPRILSLKDLEGRSARLSDGSLVRKIEDKPAPVEQAPLKRLQPRQL
jgi:hypothetical protein